MKNAMLTCPADVAAGPGGPGRRGQGHAGDPSSKYLFSSEIVSLNRQQKTGLAFGLGYAFEINPKMMLEAHVAFMATRGRKRHWSYAPGETALATYRNQVARPAALLQVPPEGGRLALCRHRAGIQLHPGAHPGSPNMGKASIFPITQRNLCLPSTSRWAMNCLSASGACSPKCATTAGSRTCLKNPEASVKGESVSFLLGGIYYL